MRVNSGRRIAITLLSEVKMAKKQRPKEEKDITPSTEAQELAMYLASVVRNAMEDFHCRHLSDEQMKELNPIIRNAIYTALYARENYNRSLAAQNFVDFSIRLIPDYWEEPTLTDDFLKSMKYFERR
jgi:hypothetical protein